MQNEIALDLVWTEEADQSLGLPSYASAGASGFDLKANFPSAQRQKGQILAPMQRALIPTGLCFALPKGTEMQIRPRSGLALRHGVSVLNTPGTIDSDYRGQVQVILINFGQEPFTVAHADRIAQAVIAPVCTAHLRIVPELSDTARGTGGFGSTGRR